MKTWEKTKIYRDIRSYEKYGKNFIYMPRQDFVKWVKMLKNKGFGDMERVSTFNLLICIL